MSKLFLKKIGLMDKKIIGHYRDDTEFTYRVFKKGYIVVFEPRARVIHTATDVGGNVSPDQKRKWAYWYHRNTSYFFFKHLYNGNVVKLFAYLVKELLTSVLRAIVYVNPYFITEIKSVKEGYKLCRS